MKARFVFAGILLLAFALVILAAKEEQGKVAYPARLEEVEIGAGYDLYTVEYNSSKGNFDYRPLRKAESGEKHKLVRVFCRYENESLVAELLASQGGVDVHVFVDADWVVSPTVEEVFGNESLPECRRLVLTQTAQAPKVQLVAPPTAELATKPAAAPDAPDGPKVFGTVPLGLAALVAISLVLLFTFRFLRPKPEKYKTSQKRRK